MDKNLIIIVVLVLVNQYSWWRLYIRKSDHFSKSIDYPAKEELSKLTEEISLLRKHILLLIGCMADKPK